MAGETRDQRLANNARLRSITGYQGPPVTDKWTDVQIWQQNQTLSRLPRPTAATTDTGNTAANVVDSTNAATQQIIQQALASALAAQSPVGTGITSSVAATPAQSQQIASQLAATDPNWYYYTPAQQQAAIDAAIGTAAVPAAAGASGLLGMPTNTLLLYAAIGVGVWYFVKKGHR